MYNYPGDTPFIESALSKMGALHNPDRPAITVGKVRECGPLKRLSSFAAAGHGASPELVRDLLKHAEEELAALEAAFEAGSQILDFMVEALSRHAEANESIDSTEEDAP